MLSDTPIPTFPIKREGAHRCPELSPIQAIPHFKDFAPLVGGGADSLGGKLSSVKDVPSLAVVDDTVFSGLTMRTVLGAMPPELLSRTHAFCLRCVGESLPAIEALCPISAGFAATGHILEDVSFINASGLVTRVGIRRANKPPLAFFDRPEWVNAWFPDYGTEVVELCKRLNALLEPGPT